MMVNVRIFFYFIFLITSGCQQESAITPEPVAEFKSAPESTAITPGMVDEASGIADSRSHNDALWIQEDSGNPAQLNLLSYAGSLIKKISLENAINRDWEDMTVSGGPNTGVNYIYLADIGDNNQHYADYWIYRFPEPAPADTKITTYDKIAFKYPDGSHDAEAILIDASRKDIFIITKRDAKSGIYKISYPQNITGMNMAISEGNLNYTGVTSASVSPDGSEVLVKTYTHIYLYKRSGNEPLSATLKKQPLVIPYSMEPQGEAVCFKKDNSGFFTLSEKAMAPAVSLRYYKRK